MLLCGNALRELAVRNFTPAERKAQKCPLLTGEDRQVANRPKKRCSMPCVVREMQIETAMRCHYAPL